MLPTPHTGEHFGAKPSSKCREGASTAVSQVLAVSEAILRKWNGLRSEASQENFEDSSRQSLEIAAGTAVGKVLFTICSLTRFDVHSIITMLMRHVGLFTYYLALYLSENLPSCSKFSGNKP